MNRSDLLFVATSAVLLAGCAATNGNHSTADNDEEVYVTGSRIPVQDTVPTGIKATPHRQSIDDTLRRPRAQGGVTGAGGS
jgi:hypothetical protein